MRDKLNERRQQVADRFLQSTFGLWNALLTVNGILLAAFSAVYAVSPKVDSNIVLAIIGACVLSLVLLVYNFIATKITYYCIGQAVTDEDIDLSEQKRKRDISQAVLQHNIVRVIEVVCFLLLLIEAGLIIAFVSGIQNNAA